MQEVFKLTCNKVSRIKERVEEKEGIPPAQQRLIYGGKQMYASFLHHTSHSFPFTLLSRYHIVHMLIYPFSVLCRADDKSAADYQLEGGATLHLVLALRGGL